MYRNNFDCSSTGLNIEVSACYDSGLSQITFDDMYYVVRNNRREVSFVIRRMDLEDNIPTKVSEVGKFMSGKRGPMTKELMCEILNEYSDYAYDTESFTHKDLFECLQDIDIKWLPDIITDYREFFKLKDGLTIYTTRGYCQGDVARILCKEETAKNYWELLDHEMWDCPVYACITIEGCEYNYCEYGLDEYNFERNKFVDAVVKAHTNNIELQQKIKKQLDVMVPNELEVV